MSRIRRERGRMPGLGRLAVAVAIVAGLTAGALWVRRGGARQDPVAQAVAPRPRLEDALPADTSLLVRIDLRAVRASRLGATLVDADRQIEGVGTLRQLCGFDPLERVESLAVVVPPGDDVDFAVLAEGEFTLEAMAGCATRLVEARGGKPLRSTLGGFVTVRDAGASGAEGEVALAPGLLLLGGGRLLRTLVDTAEGRIPSLASAPAHAELRAALPERLDVVATLALGPEQRAAVREELERAEGPVPPALAKVRGAAAGLRLDGERLHAAAALATDDDDGAAAMLELLTRLRDDLGASPAATLLGTAELVRRVKLARRPPGVWLELEASTTELERAGARAAELRGLAELGLLGGGAPRRPGPSPSAGALPIAPSESVAPQASSPRVTSPPSPR